MKRLIFVSLLFLGCEVKANINSQPTDTRVKEFIQTLNENMVFFRHPETGLCFAVTSYSNMTYYSIDPRAILFTSVRCSALNSSNLIQ